MATAYSIFANGGYRVNPWLIAKVTDHKGKVISETVAPAPGDLPRVIEARNAFVMSSLLQEITRSGTAARAQATLKRPDLYGKTGTTNDSVDAWFAGYQPTIAAVTWIGYDTPRNLGSRETGGGLSLPVWISFMEKALKGVPVMEPTVPPGVVNSGGEWFYEENARNPGIASVGMDDRSSAAAQVAPMAPPPQEERNRILDLFRN
jgi:penicillin-binding protein 1A